MAAAVSCASALGLSVDDATVLNDSNRLLLRLTPCDVVARVARIPMMHRASAELEVEVAARLVATDSPVAAPDPRVPARAHVKDGFVVTLWTYYEPVASPEMSTDGWPFSSAADYARMLERLHAGLRQIDIEAPHFTDRVADTQRDVASREATPELADADREFLSGALRGLTRSIVARGAAEQLLHGEPHPWNVLTTRSGPLFVDFENVVRGPLEYDLAWVPEDVAESYPGVDRELLDECRGLCSPSSQRGAGVPTINIRAAGPAASPTSKHCARVRRGRRSCAGDRTSTAPGQSDSLRRRRVPDSGESPAG
jgi:hypothetical protein